MFDSNKNLPNGSVVGPAPQPQPVQPQVAKKKHNTQLIETIILIVVSLIAATFIGLFIFMYIQWDAANTNLQGQIDAAVANAVETNTAELQAKFAEEEKYPYETFTGPEEYGRLSFEYPKTWSVYINKNNSDGGDFEAYFNPDQVFPVGVTTINALRVSILSKSVEEVTKSYESNLKKGLLTQVAYQFANTNESANFYEGELPSSKLHGVAVVFKLRDKTAIIQTDANQFRGDFDNLLKTVTYAQ